MSPTQSQRSVPDEHYAYHILPARTPANKGTVNASTSASTGSGTGTGNRTGQAMARCYDDSLSNVTMIGTVHELALSSPRSDDDGARRGLSPTAPMGSGVSSGSGLASGSGPASASMQAPAQIPQFQSLPLSQSQQKHQQHPRNAFVRNWSKASIMSTQSQESLDSLSSYLDFANTGSAAQGSHGAFSRNVSFNRVYSASAGAAVGGGADSLQAHRHDQAVLHSAAPMQSTPVSSASHQGLLVSSSVASSSSPLHPWSSSSSSPPGSSSAGQRQGQQHEQEQTHRSSPDKAASLATQHGAEASPRQGQRHTRHESQASHTGSQASALSLSMIEEPALMPLLRYDCLGDGMLERGMHFDTAAAANSHTSSSGKSKRATHQSNTFPGGHVHGHDNEDAQGKQDRLKRQASPSPHSLAPIATTASPFKHERDNSSQPTMAPSAMLPPPKAVAAATAGADASDMRPSTMPGESPLDDFMRHGDGDSNSESDGESDSDASSEYSYEGDGEQGDLTADTTVSIGDKAAADESVSHADADADVDTSANSSKTSIYAGLGVVQARKCLDKSITGEGGRAGIRIENDGTVVRTRRRTRPAEAHVLMRFFEDEQFPTGEQREQLARQTGLAPRAVTVWFQNRRQIEKKKKDRAARLPRRWQQRSPPAQQQPEQPISEQQQSQQQPQQPQKEQQNETATPLPSAFQVEQLQRELREAQLQLQVLRQQTLRSDIGSSSEATATAAEARAKAAGAHGAASAKDVNKPASSPVIFGNSSSSPIPESVSDNTSIDPMQLRATVPSMNAIPGSKATDSASIFTWRPAVRDLRLLLKDTHVQTLAPGSWLDAASLDDILADHLETRTLSANITDLSTTALRCTTVANAPAAQLGVKQSFAGALQSVGGLQNILQRVRNAGRSNKQDCVPDGDFSLLRSLGDVGTHASLDDFIQHSRGGSAMSPVSVGDQQVLGHISERGRSERISEARSKSHSPSSLPFHMQAALGNAANDQQGRSVSEPIRTTLKEAQHMFCASPAMLLPPGASRVAISEEHKRRLLQLMHSSSNGSSDEDEDTRSGLELPSDEEISLRIIATRRASRRLEKGVDASSSSKSKLAKFVARQAIRDQKQARKQKGLLPSSTFAKVMQKAHRGLRRRLGCQAVIQRQLTLDMAAGQDRGESSSEDEVRLPGPKARRATLPRNALGSRLTGMQRFKNAVEPLERGDTSSSNSRKRANTDARHGAEGPGRGSAKYALTRPQAPLQLQIASLQGAEQRSNTREAASSPVSSDTEDLSFFGPSKRLRVDASGRYVGDNMFRPAAYMLNAPGSRPNFQRTVTGPGRLHGLAAYSSNLSGRSQPVAHASLASNAGPPLQANPSVSASASPVEKTIYGSYLEPVLRQPLSAASNNNNIDANTAPQVLGETQVTSSPARSNSGGSWAGSDEDKENSSPARASFDDSGFFTSADKATSGSASNGQGARRTNQDRSSSVPSPTKARVRALVEHSDVQRRFGQLADRDRAAAEVLLGLGFSQ
ncbi:hypothetical protein K437DRAFT_81582 [Tilletiaria anomala UBC 951]|uniref:Homeobox domain-containing protein n=1 Tax=Tilletiaria anomala (strain ATCC 24038 / CBS 436.72 / UBC 951) TaxID=1037660 RepID=A0A066W4L7_TILAU|nr:uncharacterized protein K437DRAFT_81582 [Tilletiaria anomala UBC 951]KDN48877.1 hypothetical protein K437DRAFT_81582 [Tilletiaria anomala UBC 951]